VRYAAGSVFGLSVSVFPGSGSETVILHISFLFMARSIIGVC
jgi:hypothetical protein